MRYQKLTGRSTHKAIDVLPNELKPYYSRRKFDKPSFPVERYPEVKSQLVKEEQFTGVLKGVKGNTSSLKTIQFLMEK